MLADPDGVGCDETAKAQATAGVRVGGIRHSTE